ncbi:MAG: Gfo/Idh/MocA family protein [Bacteroidota bacterium]
MDKKLRFALIGCGAISKKHIESLRNIPDAELTAVCDIDKDAAAKTGQSYHVPYYTDAHELAKKEAFDVFVVVTPSGSHAQVILELVQYEKHFVVEKPLALRLFDVDEIIRACDTKGCKLFVVQQNRFNPPIVQLKKALEAGRFGKIVLATARVRWCRRQDYYDQKKWRGTWQWDGGVLANQANHHVDMLTWLIGDVDEVSSMSATRLVKIEAEDTIVACLKFHNGALGVIEATTATRPKDLEGSISVLGEKGSVEIGGFYTNKLKLWSFENKLPEDDAIVKNYSETPETFAWNHMEYYKNVIHSIRQHKKGLVDGFEGRKSIELINAIYESTESGEKVPLRFVPSHSRLGKNAQ